MTWKAKGSSHLTHGVFCSPLLFDCESNFEQVALKAWVNKGLWCRVTLAGSPYPGLPILLSPLPLLNLGLSLSVSFTRLPRFHEMTVTLFMVIHLTLYSFTKDQQELEFLYIEVKDLWQELGTFLAFPLTWLLFCLCS